MPFRKRLSTNFVENEGGAQPTRKKFDFSLPIIGIVLITSVGLGIKNVIWKKPAADTIAPAVVQTSNKPKTDETAELLAKVGQHISIPSGIKPLIGTVIDADEMRRQNAIFFKLAENGDRVLVWEGDKAVLYSEKKDLILAAMPAPSGTQAAAEQTTSTSIVTLENIADIKIEVRNGTGVGGKAKALADKLKALGYTVLNSTNAAKTYPNSLFIRTSQDFLENEKKILELVPGAEDTIIPAGEKPARGTFLIILGQDYLN